MIKVFALAVSAAALFASSASAATLSTTGPVSLNRGNGFQAVSGAVHVRPGDRVLVGAGGSANIAYSSSCVTTVQANQLTVVATNIPCDGMMRLGANRRVISDTTYHHQGGHAGFSFVPAVVGVVSAAGVIGAIVSSERDGKDHRYPVSP